MNPTFPLLGLAVLSLWIGGAAPAPAWRRHFWLVCFGAALVAGLAGGIVLPAGLAVVVAWVAACWWWSRPPDKPWQNVLAAGAVLVLATGLALHLLPGFHNLRVITAVRFTPDALPYTRYLDFDKTVLGLFLLGWGHERITRAREWRAMLVTAVPWAAGLLAVVLLLSVAAGYVRLAPKFPEETWLWLGVNLGFTCMAEEALFRGFIQTQLQRWWAGWRGGLWLALGVAALLFGLAHAAGGPVSVALATVAGLGYGWIYQRTGRIEASILTHFGLNTVHFFFFTYPALAGALH